MSLSRLRASRCRRLLILIPKRFRRTLLRFVQKARLMPVCAHEGNECDVVRDETVGFFQKYPLQVANFTIQILEFIIMRINRYRFSSIRQNVVSNTKE